MVIFPILIGGGVLASILTLKSKHLRQEAGELIPDPLGGVQETAESLTGLVLAIAAVYLISKWK